MLKFWFLFNKEAEMASYINKDMNVNIKMNFIWILPICTYDILAASKTDGLSSDKTDHDLEKSSPVISEKSRGEVKTDATISRENNPWWPPNSNYETPGNEIGHPWSLLQDGFQLGNNKICPQEKFEITSHCNFMAGAVKMSETVECEDEKKRKIPAFQNVSYRYELSGLPSSIAIKLVKLLRSDPTTSSLMNKYTVYHEEKDADDYVQVAILWFNAIYWQVTGSYTFCSENGTVKKIDGVKARFPIYTRDRMMEGLFGIWDFCRKDSINATNLISHVEYSEAKAIYDYCWAKNKVYDLSW